MFSLHLSDNVKTITQDKQTAKRNSLFERNFCFCFFRSRHLFTFFWGVSYLHRLLPCDKLKSFVFAQMPSVSNIHTKVQEWGTTKRNSYQLSIRINIASETDKLLWIVDRYNDADDDLRNIESTLIASYFQIVGNLPKGLKVVKMGCNLCQNTQRGWSAVSSSDGFPQVDLGFRLISPNIFHICRPFHMYGKILMMAFPR